MKFQIDLERQREEFEAANKMPVSVVYLAWCNQYVSILNITTPTPYQEKWSDWQGLTYEI